MLRNSCRISFITVPLIMSDLQRTEETRQDLKTSLSPITPADNFINQGNKLEWQMNIKMKLGTMFSQLLSCFYFSVVDKSYEENIPSTRTQLVEKTTHKGTSFFFPPSTAETTAVLGGKAFVLLVIILTPGQAKETEPCVIQSQPLNLHTSGPFPQHKTMSPQRLERID